MISFLADIGMGPRRYLLGLLVVACIIALVMKVPVYRVAAGAIVALLFILGGAFVMTLSLPSTAPVSEAPSAEEMAAEAAAKARRCAMARGARRPAVDRVRHAEERRPQGRQQPDGIYGLDQEPERP